MCTFIKELQVAFDVMQFRNISFGLRAIARHSETCLMNHLLLEPILLGPIEHHLVRLVLTLRSGTLHLVSLEGDFEFGDGNEHAERTDDSDFINSASTLAAPTLPLWAQS